MSTICGIVYKNGQRANKNLIQDMQKAMSSWSPDRQFLSIDRYSAFASNLLFSRRTPGEPANLLENERYIILFDAQFDSHQTTSKEFNRSWSDRISHDLNSGLPVPEFGTGFSDFIKAEAANLRGDYAIAIWDKNREELLLIRDHFGKRPLFYIETSEYFAFATEMKALFAIPGFSPQMDDQWIADSISTVKSEKDRSPYINIKRMLPGHYLVHKNQETHISKYWDLTFNPDIESLDEEEALSIFKQKLFRAVSSKIRNAVSVGSELSGGLDSSGVTALAWHYIKESGIPFYALSHALADHLLGNYFPYKDEREYSQAIIDYCGIPEHLFCTAEGKGIISTLKKTIDNQSGPTQQGYNIFADSLYERAEQNNVRVLLSGFGGDEGVTSQGAGIYHELKSNGKWDEYFHELVQRSKDRNKSLFKARIKYFIDRYGPFSSEYIANVFSGNSDWRVPKFKGLGFDTAFGELMNIKERYFERVNFPDDNEVRKRQYKRIMHDHVPQRFEYSFLAAQYRGMQYAYPFWDVDLVDFYFSLPALLKVKNGQRRYIYRESMKNLLPEKIRQRDDKTGATVPTVQMRFMNDYQKIRGLILHSAEVNKFHYLDYDKMLEWAERIKNRGFKDKMPANPGGFFNSLQILLLQEMERNGTFKRGIKY